MTELQQAFQEWMDAFPGKIEGSRYLEGKSENHYMKIYNLPRNWNGDCPCPQGAFYHTYLIREAGQSDRIVIRPDQDVCDRERAWRKYVRIRGK